MSSDVVEIVKKLCFDKEERAEEEEDADGPVDLDPGMQRDVTAIRKLGFGVFEIGERRLKGLETPELISLIYPRALAGRLNGYGASLGGADGKMDEVYEPTPRMIDVDHIRQLAVLVMRLEAGAPLVGLSAPGTDADNSHSVRGSRARATRL